MPVEIHSGGVQETTLQYFMSILAPWLGILASEHNLQNLFPLEIIADTQQKSLGSFAARALD
jgi:hypothetical protein